ncbi:hypothetical protein WBG99_32170 [Streptomyces sp. TG1A-60]|uniref:hypothetical protein n=1 Tax=Streptomyces sp. TG1A-60 TaxID=3129111 RepID=UPI0030CEDFC3
MARVPYLRREDADEARQPLYDRLEAERKVPTANIFLALTNTHAAAFLTIGQRNAAWPVSACPTTRVCISLVPS